MNSFLSRLKATLYRYYYRHINTKAWGDHRPGADIQTSTLLIPTGETELRTRVYHGQPDRPLIIYFHGGGIGNMLV